MTGDRPLHHHLGRLPRRGRPATTTATTSRRRLHPQFDDWAREYRMPVRRPHGRRGQPELGPPTGGWPSSRPTASSPRSSSPTPSRPSIPSRRLKAQLPGATEGDLELRWAGLRAHNRWLADFCAAAPGRRARHRPDHAARRRRRRWPRSSGRPRPGMTRRRPAARRPSRAPASSPSTRGSTTRSGGPARWPGSPSTTTAAAPCRPSGDAGHRQGHVHARGHLVGPPVPVAPHLRRRARAPSRPAVRLHRAGHRLDPRDPRHPRLLLPPDGHRDRLPGARVGAARRLAARPCDRASTGPASATSGRASCARPRRPCATPSASTRSCGAATTPTRSRAIPFSREALRLSFAGIDPVEVQADARRQRRPASSASTWTASAEVAAAGRADPRRDQPSHCALDEIPSERRPLPGLRRRQLT